VSHLESLEGRVLLLCARPSLDPQAPAILANSIADGLDWTALTSLALHHHVVPALQSTFAHSSFRSLVPPEILDALEGYCDEVRRRNAYLVSELTEILTALSAAGITALPFKGVVLAKMLYRDLAQRPPGDLDFLVRARDVTRTCEVLVSRGYRDVAGSSGEMTALQHEMYRRYQCEYLLVRDHDRVFVEPHWAFSQRVLGIDLAYDEQFARARRTRLNGTDVLVHDPHDLLLLLCVHGAKHEWGRLNWIRDVGALLERRAAIGLDMDRALDLARKQGCARLLLLGAEVARQLLHVSLSDGLQRAVTRDAGVAPLAKHVVNHLFAPNRRASQNRWLNGFRFRMHERVTGRIRYVGRTLLLPRREHIEMVKFPRVLMWLYYPLRWAHDYVALPLWILTRPLRQSRKSVRDGSA
jgi:hypothetical protein